MFVEHAKVSFFQGRITYVIIFCLSDRHQPEHGCLCRIHRQGHALPHVLLLAVATSIDAFAVGITFAFLKVDILSSIAIIGVTTFVLCFAAVYLGSKLGSLLKKYAGILGGVILILIGARILIEHLFF